jgi:predicted dehydrogenase
VTSPSLVNGMTSTRLRIACHGRNGHQIHRALLAGIPGAELVAISGFEDPEIPPSVARHLDVDGLLAAGDIDLISLCSPRRDRQALDAQACLQAGVHVYAEKPAAMRRADLERCVDLATARGLVFREMAGTVDEPPFPDLESLVADGAVGTPFQILIQKSYPWHLDRPVDAGIDGGVRLQVGVHALRIAEHLLGPISMLHTQECAIGDPGGRGLIMAANLSWRHTSGAIGVAVANYGGAAETGVWGNDAVRVFGSDGHLVWSAADGPIRIWRRSAHPQLVMPHACHPPHFHRVLDACCRDDRLPPLDHELHPTRLLLDPG